MTDRKILSKEYFDSIVIPTKCWGLALPYAEMYPVHNNEHKTRYELHNVIDLSTVLVLIKEGSVFTAYLMPTIGKQIIKIIDLKYVDEFEELIWCLSRHRVCLHSDYILTDDGLVMATIPPTTFIDMRGNSFTIK